MKKREIIGLIILFFLVLISAGPASAATLTVDDDGSADYMSIREAVNSANENDTIFVYSGTYAGNISVDKKLVLKGVDKGNGMPVIDGSECNENGFSLFADEIILDGFEIRNCDEGIRVFSAGNTIINNTLSNCFFGIWVYEIVDRSVWRHISSNNYIENNKIFENSYGILLDKSDGNILRNNDMRENYYNFQLWSGTYAHNDIDKSNLVNGKPLYYLVGKSDTVIDSSLDVGALYCIDCYNISILNLEIKGSGNGINLFNISNSLVRDNTISSCREGLTITESSGNTIRDNQISSGYYGLILNDLHDNVFRNNRMSSNEYNFEARNCKANDLDISNTVDGKPIYYLYGEAGDVIDASSNAGTVYCIDCDDIVIEGLDLKNSDNGIYLYNTSNSLVKDNTISSCDEGIRIIDSSGNTILNNQITSSYFGLLLAYSNGNNFRNNLMSSNMWNFAARGCKANDLDLSNTVDGKPIYYLYGESGKIIDASSNAGLVYCRDCSDITIKDLSLKNNYNGVCLENTSNSIIENCIIDECGSGVELSDCSNSNILGNRINVENGWDAIEIFGCDNNLFADNILNVEESGLYGIDMWDSHGNIFVRNRITAYETLISLDNDIDNTFYLNDFWLEDDFPGIVGASAPVDSPSPSLIPERAFRDFERERPEKFCEEYNEADGIKLTVSASGGGSGEDGINTGLWNSSEALNYSYQGKKFTGYLGNYWNYYEASDSNGDGIGNSPCMVRMAFDYEEVESEYDNYPLMKPASNYVVEGDSLIDVSFSANVTLGPAPLAVRFEALSDMSIFWKWDFDGDGLVDSTEKNPVYIYEKPGIYTVSLTAGNALGTGRTEIEDLITVTAPPKITSFAPISALITDYEGDTRSFEVAVDQVSNLTWYLDGENLYSNLSVQASSCTLSASAETEGGGGAKVHELTVLAENENGTCRLTWAWVIIPAEPPENIRARDSVEVNITGNGPVFYGFEPENNFSILNLSFEASGGLGNVKAMVEILNEPSENVPVLPPGKIYRHLNLRVGSYEFGKSGTGNATVLFRIEKTWFNETDVNVSTIRLCRYDSGRWERLPTKIVEGSDQAFHYFEAITPGFSSFVIGSPLIKAVNPETEGTGPLESVKDKEQKFGVETSRECNLSWYINGSLVQEDSNTTYAEYKNDTAPAGVYNVTVFASGDNESDKWTWLWKVIPVPDTSSGKDGGGTGGSGGSGGGGGGGSPEPASNVEIKELAQAFVTKGMPVSFNFVRNATCVNYVNFDSLKTAGKVTTIVEMLKGQSRLVPELPPAKVYKNLNIWVGNSGFATPENLENSFVGFRVEKTWLEGAGVDAASIILWKYEDNEWKQLETGKVGEDSDSIFFEAGTPGFSSFAITGGQVRSKTELGQLEEDSGQKALNSDVGKSGNPEGGEESRNTTDENRLPGFGFIGVVFGLLFSGVIEKRNHRP